jgi:hypothetical protein
MNVIDEKVRRYMFTLIRGNTLAMSGKARRAIAVTSTDVVYDDHHIGLRSLF